MRTQIFRKSKGRYWKGLERWEGREIGAAKEKREGLMGKLLAWVGWGNSMDKVCYFCLIKEVGKAVRQYKMS